ncbi:hypothetical protein [Saccharothrix syringae]|uniref:DUF3558 domain-containing protein n=1 Tax=Saccharothrix syringae TaxID=103733 RepID=A0A5Q0H2K2_SACSY|nr:hypothetical protein [Saccharothrix syringae]QFZ20104.1 hypothetical protein EKG83_24190 [Saccharothrix syringae]
MYVRGVVALVCAGVLVAGCSAQAGPPAAPVVSEDPAVAAAAVVARLALGEQVTGPAGLVPAGEPETGVQPLVECRELASAGQALAGRTQRWTWTAPDGRTATYSLYGVVYQGVAAREVVKQARVVSECYPRQHDPSGYDRQRYSEESLPSTRPIIDDRFGYCERDPVDYGLTIDQYLATPYEYRCTALFAHGNKVLRFHYVSSIDRKTAGSGQPSVHTLAQSLVDLIVAA